MSHGSKAGSSECIVGWRGRTKEIVVWGREGSRVPRNGVDGGREGTWVGEVREGRERRTAVG